jgi:Fe2+ or Zn2+ uptake regulation protein
LAVQAANQRTPEEQLANLDKQGLTATKERLKIARKLAKAGEAAKAPKKAKS